MHDPMCVAFEIKNPIPRFTSWRKPKKRWSLSRRRRTNPENLGEPIYPWFRLKGWEPVVAGRRMEMRHFITVWHVEPGGHDSGEVCRHHVRTQDENGKWEIEYKKTWKWHVHHWHIQISPLQEAQRRLFQRCAWCNGKSTKKMPVNCSAQWDGPGPEHFWSSAPHLSHSGCSSAPTVLATCLCEVPLVKSNYTKCERCGKFYGTESGHIGTREAVRISGLPQKGKRWSWPKSVNCHEIEKRLEAERDLAGQTAGPAVESAQPDQKE